MVAIPILHNYKTLYFQYPIERRLKFKEVIQEIVTTYQLQNPALQLGQKPFRYRLFSKITDNFLDDEEYLDNTYSYSDIPLLKLISSVQISIQLLDGRVINAEFDRQTSIGELLFEIFCSPKYPPIDKFGNYIFPGMSFSTSDQDNIKDENLTLLDLALTSGNSLYIYDKTPPSKESKQVFISFRNWQTGEVKTSLIALPADIPVRFIFQKILRELEIYTLNYANLEFAGIWVLCKKQNTGNWQLENIIQPNETLNSANIQSYENLWLDHMGAGGGGTEISSPILFNQVNKSKFDNATFLVVYPREVELFKTFNLIISVQKTDKIDKIITESKNLLKSITGDKRFSYNKSSDTEISQGTQITFVPTLDDFDIIIPSISGLWQGSTLQVILEVPLSHLKTEQAITGRVDVYVDNIIVEELRFAFHIVETPKSDEVTTEVKKTGNRKIFISYSQKDTIIVQSIAKAYDALGDDYFVDRQSLLSGANWEEEIARAITESDIFQLFWSENSATSKYCEIEWKQAIRIEPIKGDRFIRPFYWSKILAKLPTELSKYHFKYVSLLVGH